jgi:hypothetical protein
MIGEYQVGKYRVTRLAMSSLAILIAPIQAGLPKPRRYQPRRLFKLSIL